MSAESMRRIEKENESRILSAGRAVFARTGRTPTLSGLQQETGLARATAVRARRRLREAGLWPWSVRRGGDWRDRDGRGLTTTQARWVEAFALAARNGSVRLAAAGAIVGASEGRAHQVYHLLSARGVVLPPLHRPRTPAVHRPGRPEPRPPGPDQIARMAAAIRREHEANGRPASWAGHGVSRRMRSRGALVYDSGDVNP